MRRAERMKERKADIVLATVVALTFAAFAAGGIWYLRSLDGWARQSEEKLSPEAYIGLGAAEKAESGGLIYQQGLGAVEFSSTLLELAALLCAVLPVARLWVAPPRWRVMKANPPRAPAL